jgi:hypothetical protein
MRLVQEDQAALQRLYKAAADILRHLVGATLRLTAPDIAPAHAASCGQDLSSIPGMQPCCLLSYAA